MNGKDLLNFLNKLTEEELSHPIIINIEYGYGESMMVTDVDVNLSSFTDDSDNEREFIMLRGEEDTGEEE